MRWPRMAAAGALLAGVVGVLAYWPHGANAPDMVRVELAGPAGRVRALVGRQCRARRERPCFPVLPTVRVSRCAVCNTAWIGPRAH